MPEAPVTALAMKFDVQVSEGGDSLSVDVEVELTELSPVKI